MAKTPTVPELLSAELQLTFEAADTTARGCVFVYQPPKVKGKAPKKEIYIRAKADNVSAIDAGVTRVFLTRLGRVDPKTNTKTILTDDTFELNWAASRGQERVFYPDFEHYADLLYFKEGAKSFELMTVGKPTYLKPELQKAGIYRMHLLLTGEFAKPQRAILEFKWPMKATKGDYSKNFSFSLTK